MWEGAYRVGRLLLMILVRRKQALTSFWVPARTGVIVGKNQDRPIVADQTGNNDVLESSAVGWTPAWGNARGFNSADARSRFQQQLNTLMDVRKPR